MSIRRLVSIAVSGVVMVAAGLAVGGGAGADAMVLVRAKHVGARWPKFDRLAHPDLAQSVTCLYADGSLLGRAGGRNRRSVGLAAIAPVAIQALLAAEDRHFWTEPGIDPAGIVRSAVEDLAHPDRRPAGASTIPQQVVKNLVMDDPPMTLSRKIDEAILALRAVARYGRPYLLDLYLNQTYLGHGAYGIEAAAHTYFDTDAAHLDLDQAALIAGLPQAPTAYDPFVHPQAARARRRYVLGRMAVDGMITETAASAAIAAPLGLKPPPSTDAGTAHTTDPATGGVHAPSEIADADGWALEYAQASVARLGLNHPRTVPLVVKTSIDPRLQILAQRALQAGLERWSMHEGWKGPIGHGDPAVVARPDHIPPWLRRAEVLHASRGRLSLRLIDGTIVHADAPRPRSGVAPVRPGDVVLVGRPMPKADWAIGQPTALEGSLVAIDPATGAVRAIAGGMNYVPGGFDRATRAVRQPGSAFKPFIYLTAATLGDTVDTPVLDAPISLSQGKSMPLWSPDDDGERPMGLVSFRKALALSLNDAAVRLLYQVGRQRVAAVAAALGVYPAITSYAAALGAQGVTNLRLAGGYAALADHGAWTRPGPIMAIVQDVGHAGSGRQAAVIWQRPGPRQVVSAQAVDTVDQAMAGTIEIGTAHAYAGLEKLYPGLGGKTGTSQNYHDAWFEGIDPGRFVVGVQIGYDQPKSIGYHAFGAEVALPIFADFVKAAFASGPSKLSN